MAGFQIPSFGFSLNSQQGFGSPKPYHSTPVYQPMPAVGTPSFGGLGRPNTPKELSRHSSYSTKETEPTIQPIQPSVERVRRHREYYLEGGDIYFLVENYLFRVHRYFFERESPVFRKQFADIALNGHHRLGASDNEPLVLNDVTTDDFSRFLWVFYNPIYSIYDASTEDWAAILGLAYHWQFSEVKSLVVRELEKQIIPSIYKIVIYHRHDVDRGLLLPSYMDLVSREETLNFEEAKDLGLETSLMIMTAREIVRKGETPTATLNVSQEELRSIIRQVFRFPGPRSDSPLSDITAAEPALDLRSPPLIAEKTDLPTVPEHEDEPVTFTSSASLNSPLPPVTETPAPAPFTTPAPAPSTPNKKAASKPTPATPKREDTKATPVNPPKEEPKPKDGPAKTTDLPKQGGEPKPRVQEPAKPATEAPPKPEAQDNNKKPVLSRLSDVSKGAGSPTPTKEGDKPAENKEAKDAKDTTGAKDVAGPPTPGQDPNGTPISTPLLNQDTGTPSTGQSVSAKKTKALLTRAGEIKRGRAVQETVPNSNNKDKDMEPESLKVPSPTKLTASSQTCSEPREPESGAKEVEVKTDVNGKGKKKKVAGDKKKDKGKPAEVAGVDIPKGSVNMDDPGKKGDAGQDTKKPGEGAIDSSDNVKVTPPAATPATTTTDKKEDTEKGTANPTVKEEKVVPTIGENAAKPKDGAEPSEQKAEPFITDEGDVATPKRVTKELPASPAKSLKEKLVPTLGLVVPKSSKKASDPPSTATATDPGLSPLQKVLKDAKDETLMERMARLEIGDASRPPPKDMVPPAHTDLESDSECVTAPSGPGTPRSRAGRGSFNLLLRSDIPLSDDDEFFVDCDSNASVSNFDGV